MNTYFDTMFSEVDPNIKLDENQRTAILDGSKKALIIAGAGSGKTTTISAKIKYLVEKKYILPSEIILISYTNFACDELRERINDGFGIPVKIYTFHKLGLEILKKQGKFTISDPFEGWLSTYQQECLRKSPFFHSFIFSLNPISVFLWKNFHTPIDIHRIKEVTVSLYRYYQTTNLDLEEIRHKCRRHLFSFFFLSYFIKMVEDYQKYKEQQGIIDFDDMVNKAYELLEEGQFQ